MVEEFDECKLWVGVEYFFDCFIVVAIIAGPPAFDDEQLTDEESDSDEDDLADLR